MLNSEEKKYSNSRVVRQKKFWTKKNPHTVPGLLKKWFVLLVPLSTITVPGLLKKWFVLLVPLSTITVPGFLKKCFVLLVPLSTIVVWDLQHEWLMLLWLVILLTINVWGFSDDWFVLLWMVILRFLRRLIRVAMDGNIEVSQTTDSCCYGW